jgi:hypothetical protein
MMISCRRLGRCCELSLDPRDTATGFMQLEAALGCALRGSGVVAVGGGNVGGAVQTQDADGEAAERRHHAGARFPS